MRMHLQLQLVQPPLGPCGWHPLSAAWFGARRLQAKVVADAGCYARVGLISTHDAPRFHAIWHPCHPEDLHIH